VLKEEMVYPAPPALKASKAKKASRACRDHLDLQEQMEYTVPEAPQDPKEKMENLAPRARLVPGVSLDRRDPRAMPVHQDSQGTLESKATRASRVSQENQATMERTAILDHLVIQGKEETSANRENLESQDFLDPLGDRAIQVHLGRRASVDRPAPRVQLAHRGTRVYPASRVESVPGARRDRLATPGLREYRENPVLQESPVSSVPPV